VFLSYSHADSEFAARLEEDLANGGIDTWRDAANAGSRGHIDKEIERAIDNSTHLLMLASTDAAESDYVRDELQYASNKKKPCLVVSIGFGPLPLAATRLRRIDCAADYKKGLKELISALRAPVLD